MNWSWEDGEHISVIENPLDQNPLDQRIFNYSEHDFPVDKNNNRKEGAEHSPQ